MSMKLTPAAATSTTTCPGPARGSGCSHATRTSGPPTSLTAIARMTSRPSRSARHHLIMMARHGIKDFHPERSRGSRHRKAASAFGGQPVVLVASAQGAPPLARADAGARRQVDRAAWPERVGYPPLMLTFQGASDEVAVDLSLPPAASRQPLTAMPLHPSGLVVI